MKTRYDRREFIGLTGVAVAGFASAPSLAFGSGPDPDRIVVNAKVYTMDPQAPRAEAFAVTGSRFAAVGTTATTTRTGRCC